MSNELEKIEANIKEWSHRNSIPLVYGKVSKQCPIIEINDSNKVIDFLDLGKQNNINHVIISKYFITIDKIVLGIIEENEIEDRYYDKIRELVEEELENASLNEEDIIFFSIFWVKEGIAYKLEIKNKFYNSLSIKSKELIFSDDEEENIEEDNTDSQSLMKELYPSDDEQLRVAEILAQDSNFLKFFIRKKNITPILDNILSNEGFDIEDERLYYTRMLIKNKAKNIFIKKYEKQATDKLVKEMKEMKSKGITKKKIIARLDITERFYETYI